MAYVSTEKIKEIRNTIKNVLTSKDGFKVSVSRASCGSIQIALMKSPIEFPNDYEQINHYWYKNDDDYTPAAKGVISVILEQIEKVMGQNVNRNANDPGADYCDMDYYLNLQIGKYDKPCQFVNN